MTSGSERTALVTGAGSGLGRATAVRLAADGHAVACLDLNADGAGETAAAIAGKGGTATAFGCDVSDPDSVAAAVRGTVEAYGHIDVVVNVAGIGLASRFEDTTIAQWRKVLDINLTGTFIVAHETMPELLRSKGAMINVASTAALRGWRYMTAYSASKGGIVAFTKTLAVEYGRRSVRVNCVCPGSIDTPLKQGLTPIEDADPVLMGRSPTLLDPPVAAPEEIADAISYLASPGARFVTGSVLTIDGGAVA